MSDETNIEETTVESTKATEEVGTELDPDQDPDLSTGESPDFKWYVAHALSGYENRVSKTLKERILNHKMTEYFSRILIPEENVITSVNGKKRNIKKKFFPGYVLIKMIMNDKTWHLVKNTDKITGFIGGTKEKPFPISDEEASAMINQATGGKDGKKTRSLVDYIEGESVRVIEGPFASFVGTVEAVTDKGKVKVNVSIFGRPTPVELDSNQIEKTS